MSQSPSPFSQPVADAPAPPGSSTNTTTIVAIVALTVLLMCGGVIGLGFYAVDRLADQMAEYADSMDEWDETGSKLAVEFAVEECPQIMDKVGRIESVELDSDLTYEFNANQDDYFYRIQGSTGDALVAVEFAGDDKRWFRRITLVDGADVDSPRTPLKYRKVPFDSVWSKRICDILVANEDEVLDRLEIGPIHWIQYDFQQSSDRAIEQELVFSIEGDLGSVKVVARFKNLKYKTVASIHVVDDNDQLGDAIYELDLDLDEDPDQKSNKSAESDPAI